MHISELAEGGVGAVTDVLKEGQEVDRDALKQFVKDQIGMWKYPRWIDVVTELPKIIVDDLFASTDAPAPAPAPAPSPAPPAAGDDGA